MKKGLLYFFLKIFGQFKKKQYLCTAFRFYECKFGTLPERLGIGLQNRGRRFESARYLQEAANKAASLFNNYPDFPERPGLIRTFTR